MNPKGNKLQEVASRRIQTTIPKSVTSRRDATLKSANHPKRKIHQTLPHSFGGGQGNHVPFEQRVEKPRVKSLQKHPPRACILYNEIPKSLEKPLKQKWNTVQESISRRIRTTVSKTVVSQ